MPKLSQKEKKYRELTEEIKRTTRYLEELFREKNIISNRIILDLENKLDYLENKKDSFYK
tara:strand:+ start:1471 stop:1650 length:180 start_codon:yes stop_codon:yes gene_type:complete